ncbi:hypothetical protein CHS0354_009758 [Potamilus streckersoni]|uniref:Uncharacterized protein n=1 Tax=Potamilus streckersoni TaxID=2493646 RepID=A0AAE0SUX2_9BIVA|nr:hypothetical protein CHS0354_009758 [Potamilus streckersoni]
MGNLTVQSSYHDQHSPNPIDVSFANSAFENQQFLGVMVPKQTFNHGSTEALSNVLQLLGVGFTQPESTRFRWPLRAAVFWRGARYFRDHFDLSLAVKVERWQFGGSHRVSSNIMTFATSGPQESPKNSFNTYPDSPTASAQC